MGVMIEGVWHVTEPPREADGKFRRAESPLRSWITPDGGAGPSGDGGYKAEAGRYHLYVAESCPWAHRTWIFRILKGLEDAVPMSIVRPLRTDEGWVFVPGDARYSDKQNGKTALQQLYLESHPEYTGRITVPVLWDTQTRTIVSNESSEIIRMLNAAFVGVAGNDADFYPAALRSEIDAVNARVFAGLNNGVYRAGFAHTQAAYEEAFDEVFETLDWLEARLATHRYLAGDRITEADWRAFPTLARFDVAYVGAFRCNLRRLVDYPNLWALTRELYRQPGIAATVWPEIYKRGYFRARTEHGSEEIIPKGPAIDFAAPIARDARARAAAE